MKLAIKGHFTRGKEVIQILESLGGVNKCPLKGDSVTAYYYIDYNKDNTIYCHDTHLVNLCYKKYTLEEFETQFPFKVGDEVIFPIINGWASGKIIGIKDFEYVIKTRHNYHYVEPHQLSLYPMKEERNITLTLDKAKEWYKKGGELKEVALQAYSENELNPLPRSWEEYCRKYKTSCLSTRYTNIPLKYDALIKLEQLRDCWRQGWKPDSNSSYCIKKHKTFELGVYGYCISEFLSFKDRETTEEFLKNFKDLIEKAGDLI